MFLQFVPGPFHVDPLMGCKLRAEPIRRRLTSFNVLAVRCLESSFKIPADWAIRNLNSWGLRRGTRGPDLASVQKLPEISVEVMQLP